MVDCLLVSGDRRLFAVAYASDDAEQLAVLIADAHLGIGQLVMVHYFVRLGSKPVAYLRTLHVDDVVLYPKRQLSVTVHHGGNSQVGQREIGTALTYSTGVQVFRGHLKAGTGIALANLLQYTTAVMGEAIVLR